MEIHSILADLDKCSLVESHLNFLLITVLYWFSLLGGFAQYRILLINLLTSGIGALTQCLLIRQYHYLNIFSIFLYHHLFQGRPSPSTYLAAPLVALGVETADFVNWPRESLEFFWWSAVRLLCLQLACRKCQTTSTSKSASSAVMVCTAALECLLEILSSTPAGRPPTELPEGFQEVLRIFCSMKRLHSPSAVLHLDDYDSCRWWGGNGTGN